MCNVYLLSGDEWIDHFADQHKTEQKWPCLKKKYLSQLHRCVHLTTSHLLLHHHCLCTPPPASTAFLTISKEHDNATLESPRRLKRRLDIAVGRLTTYQSQMRAQQQKRSRLHHKLEKMGIIIEELKANQIVSTSCADLLEASCSGIPWINMKHLLAGRQPSKGHAYHEDIAFSFCDGI